MVCEMESDCIEDMDIEVLSSMWPEDVGTDVGKPFNIEKSGTDHDILEEVTMIEEPTNTNLQRLMELTNYTDKGSSQLTYKHDMLSWSILGVASTFLWYCSSSII
ncbi:hypothetical protein AAZX31_18G109100 [Glycine max]|nr:hypothetical protein GLYMA_18G115250v4 [Glycine max]KAG4924133.1 hypothetical protein JHK87_049673 [Glycine soja]KAH1154141.1 hypothetical protein GYH30_049680 [Glycine max]